MTGVEGAGDSECPGERPGPGMACEGALCVNEESPPARGPSHFPAAVSPGVGALALLSTQPITCG